MEKIITLEFRRNGEIEKAYCATDPEKQEQLWQYLCQYTSLIHNRLDLDTYDEITDEQKAEEVETAITQIHDALRDALDGRPGATEAQVKYAQYDLRFTFQNIK